MFINILEEEFEGIIDDAFEEGYAQAYSELQSKTERERALQEKAWDNGYDQAIDDLIEAGVIGEEEYLDEDYSVEGCSDECCSDECYSEYEFGDVVDEEEDGEEDYCFSKELERILKSGQEQYEADLSVPSMGNRYDENDKLCGFFVNTGKNKSSGIGSYERKHSHYFKDVRHLDYIDVYQVCKLFPVDDDSGAITHSIKKLLVAGGRGAGKDMIKDITEARDTLNRYLQIEGIE